MVFDTNHALSEFSKFNFNHKATKCDYKINITNSAVLDYCAYHVLVQSNIRRYYFHILLDHFNVLDELWGENSTGFDKR